jgi:hypothetical protein
MGTYYNGYLFHADGENRVYNPSMVLYFFKQIIKRGKEPEKIVDYNLEIDYKRLSNLTKNENNRNTLIQIMKDGYVVSDLLEKFSIDRMNDDRYFVSLLFYMGLLTVGERYRYQLKLRIPNFSIQTLYWEYLAEMMRDTLPNMAINTQDLQDAIYNMAVEGDLKQYIAYVSENAFSKLSDHDLQHFDEKYIKVFLLTYLFLSKAYISMSEYETVPGRADIYLQRNPSFSLTRYEWLLELKYCKASVTEEEVAAKRSEGLTQLKQYAESYRMKNLPDLKAAVILFTGKNKFDITNYVAES